MGQESVENTGKARSLANLRPPWKPGESGNPAGRPSYRVKFEQAFGRAVEASTDDLVRVITAMAKSGDSRMMQMLLERVMPKVERHEIDAGSAPSRLVIEFQKPDTGDGGEGGGDAG